MDPSGVVRGDRIRWMKDGAVCVRDKWMGGWVEDKGLMSRLQQAHLKDDQRLIFKLCVSWNIGLNSLDSCPYLHLTHTYAHTHKTHPQTPLHTHYRLINSSMLKQSIRAEQLWLCDLIKLSHTLN